MSGSDRVLILGTAGHIDHGKTALVRLLTGVDTDRLKEEKARGISIDLGFAHLDLPGGISCGIVDVPGHERFVKNMLAGAGGVDAVLFVIAADEGVMPQTREHLDILDLLGVERGVVALTKTDMVEPDWLDLVTETVREYLEARGYGALSIVPVSSKTGAGRDEVLQALADALREVAEKPAAGRARLPVDRSFVVEGFGTVVTGTLWRGTVRPGDQLVVEPGARRARVRNVQVHGHDAGAARAGQRTALALAGLDRQEVPRGSWVLAPDTLEPSHMLDVRVRTLKGAPRALRHRQRVRFHLGASEILGRVVLLDRDELEPGKSAFAQLRLEAEAVADRGDRFVLRTYSPSRTIAGGTVILPVATKHRRHDRAALELLEREESGSPEQRAAALLAAGPEGTTREALRKNSGMGETDLDAALARLLETGEARETPGGLLVGAGVLAAHASRAETLLAEAQAANPYRWGMTRGELKSRLGKGLPAEVFEAVLAELIGAGRAWTREDWVRTGSPEPALTEEQERRISEVADALTQGGVTPPTSKELQGKQGGPVLDVLDYLTFTGFAVKVTPELFISRAAFDTIGGWIQETFRTHSEFSVADLRDGLGLSRKYSVPILEYFDRLGWTRRSGDVRVPGRALPE